MQYILNQRYDETVSINFVGSETIGNKSPYKNYNQHRFDFDLVKRLLDEDLLKVLRKIRYKR